MGRKRIQTCIFVVRCLGFKLVNCGVCCCSEGSTVEGAVDVTDRTSSAIVLFIGIDIMSCENKIRDKQNY